MKPKFKSAMTLQLSEDEWNALKQLGESKGMTSVGVIRQALRLYQFIDTRLSRGEQIKFVDKDGKEIETLIIGCGWSGMD